MAYAQWRRKADKKTIKALKKAGVVIDPGDRRKALDGLVEKGMLTKRELIDSESDLCALWGIDVLHEFVESG